MGDKFKRGKPVKAVDRTYQKLQKNKMIGRLSWSEYDLIEYMIREGSQRYNSSELASAFMSFGRHSSNDSCTRAVYRAYESGVIDYEEFSDGGGRMTYYQVTDDGMRLFEEADRIMLETEYVD